MFQTVMLSLAFSVGPNEFDQIVYEGHKVNEFECMADGYAPSMVKPVEKPKEPDKEPSPSARRSLQPSPVGVPAGAERYKSSRYTQSIVVRDGRDAIDLVPRANLETKWQASGGMVNVAGVKSDKFRFLPSKPKAWIGNISVRNIYGCDQNNRGVKREYVNGTRFDDILSYEGKCFEHRMREKVNGEWTNKVLYTDESARPPGYTGLTKTCISCHSEAGTGKYGMGLVPGGDTVISDPLDWTLAGYKAEDGATPVAKRETSEPQEGDTQESDQPGNPWRWTNKDEGYWWRYKTTTTSTTGVSQGARSFRGGRAGGCAGGG